ncbi:MAG: GNAT family N-acetyltransferase [Flavobacterium sp.]|nr:GNAT family N-acetyltransferase [Flavobacterium sp.]
MQEFYAIDNYPIDVSVTKTLFETFIKNENLGKSYLISYKTEIVGYIILTFVFSFEYKGQIAFLDELYIDENSRGKGIGNRAIQFIKDETSRSNLKLIYLEVENHNEIAQKLYLSNDFVKHNRKLLKHKLS